MLTTDNYTNHNTRKVGNENENYSQTQSPHLPTYWVNSTKGLPIALTRIPKVRELREFQIGEALAGDHYILDYRCNEYDIRRVAWSIKASGGECRVYEAHLPIEDIAANIGEFIPSVLSNAKNWDDWESELDHSPITKKDAKLLAKLAIQLLPEDEADLELTTLQQRSNFNDYSWNEFLKREKLAKNRKNPDRLKLEIQRYISESDVVKKLEIKKEILSLFNFQISNYEFKELIDSFEVANTASKSKMYSAAEFMILESEGLQWLIPGLLPQTGITILAGFPGVGKTTLAYDSAASILFGDEFLGETPTKLGKVLFVCSDELPAYIQDKFVNRGIFGSTNWQILLDWDISQISELEKHLEDFRPDLVIIDSFASIHKDEAFDENSSKADKGIRKLEALVNRYSTAAILIHHAGKNKENTGTVGAVRGSSAIAAACSFVWLLESVKDSDARTFSTPKSRGAENQKLSIRLIGQDGRWERCTPPDTQLKSLGDRILDFFNSQPVEKRFDGIEIINAIGGNDKSIYKALDRLVQRGLVTKRPSTVDPKRKVYGLPKKSTPPSPVSSQTMSTKMAESIDKQELEHCRHIVDNTVDIVDMSTMPTNDVYNTETLSQPDVHPKYSTVDTPSRQEGGGSIFSDSMLSDETNLNVVEDTKNEVPSTDTSTNFQVGDRVAFHEGDGEWNSGKVQSIQYMDGHPIAWVVSYFAFGKNRTAEIWRTDWIRGNAAQS